MHLTEADAVRIHDFDSWQEVTGDRFRLRREEKDRGLTREEALAERLQNATRSTLSALNRAVQLHTEEERRVWSLETKLDAATRPGKGEILIRIIPDVGVDPEYFEHLPAGQVTLRLDEKWYAWFDTRTDHPYDGNTEALLNDILELGLGEVITERLTNE